MLKNNPANFYDKHIAFLIEAVDIYNDDDSPDNKAAIDIARQNQAEIFDVITSFDAEHINEAFKNADDFKIKLICLITLNFFEEIEDSLQIIIDNVLKKSYQDLINATIFKQMPAWLENLNCYNYNILKREIFKVKGIEEQLEQTSLELIDLSNQISARKLIDYLNQSANVEVVYGLIGILHLDILEKAGVVFPNTDPLLNEAHGVINIENRSVAVHLFGGLHQTMEHFNRLSQFLANQGLLTSHATKAPESKNLKHLSFAAYAFFKKSASTDKPVDNHERFLEKRNLFTCS